MLKNIDLFEVLNNEHFAYLLNFVYYNEFSSLIYITLILFIINFFFKLTVAPFHAWALEIYNGAPLFSVTFLSIYTKMIIFFLLFTFFAKNFNNLRGTWEVLFFFCSILTMISAFFGALSEKQMKRFFVYSSMGHVSFKLMGIACLYYQGIEGSIIYLVNYLFSSLIFWFILIFFDRKLNYLTNLKKTYGFNVLLNNILAIVLFSLSGLPPLAGFFVKFEILYYILNSLSYYINFIIFFLTILHFFYYLRFIKIIFFETDNTFFKKKFLNDNLLGAIAVFIFFIIFFIVLIQYNMYFVLHKMIWISL